jgi:mRNA interferase MazF
MTLSNSNKYQFGDVVVVKFPFSDLQRSKQRPALVLACVSFSVSLDLLVVAMITSKIEGPRIAGDCMLADWHASGLLHPSIVRLCKLSTLEHDLIVGSLGTLSAKTLKGVKLRLKDLFQL